MHGAGMHGPTAVGWLLTVLCAAGGTVCLLRARGATAERRTAAVSEAGMGFTMAVMALSGGAPTALSPAVLMALLGMVFAALGSRELALLRRRRHQRAAVAHHLHHLVGALTMVYASLVMATAPAGGTTGHPHEGSAAELPALTGALLAYFALYVLLTAVHLLPGPARTAVAGAGGGRALPVPPPRAVRDLPGLAAACRLTMATGMLAMLLTL